MENIKFKELGLNEDILKAIDDMGFEEPSKIQKEAVPAIIEGFDIVGQAQTGTGKTLAFGAPVLNNLKRIKGKTSSIILTPTRELAVQINDELNRIAKYTGIRMLPVYGGQPIDRQIRALKRGIDLIVGTPGRVLDLIGKNVIDLSYIKFLVLDEADEMLDMGFIDDVEEIIKSCGSDRQTMLFSATMPAEVKKLSKKYMREDTKYITIAQNTVTVSTVHQFYYEVKQKDRFESLCRILDVDEPSNAIIFCKTKKGVDELAASMQNRGYNAEGMHGDMSQNQRMNTLKRFKEGNVDFLIATDVAARGIDVENISHVINYELPQDVELYVHRIGRTGRANKEGTAYSLVTPREYMMLKQIEKFTKSKIRRKEVPTVDDVLASRYNSMLNRVKETLEHEDYKRFTPLAAELDDEYNLVDVAAALMEMIYNKEISNDYTDNPNDLNSSKIRLFINAGRLDKLNPKTLLQFFSDNANIDKSDIGDIEILDKFTFADATENAANLILKHCPGKKIGRRKINIEISKPAK